VKFFGGVALLASRRVVFIPLPAARGCCGRTHPITAISFLRTIQRFESANSVFSCAVFFSMPRKRTFVNPNCSLISRNACSTLARTLALSLSAFSRN
jgi:hypothetical protein